MVGKLLYAGARRENSFGTRGGLLAMPALSPDNIKGAVHGDTATGTLRCFHLSKRQVPQGPAAELNALLAKSPFPQKPNDGTGW